jgi:hypothetical protein
MFYDTTLPGAGYPASPAPVSVLQTIKRIDGQTLADKAETTPTAFRAPRGTWFDEGFNFREPEGDAFTRHIIGLIAPFEDRQRARSKKGTDHHYLRVRHILANALRCFYYFDPALVSYFRMSGRMKGKPGWFNGNGMRNATDTLAKAGLIEVNKGEPGSASTFEATEALLFAAHDFGVTEASLSYALPSERLVRMYETNRDGPYVDFDQTDETRHWTALLGTYNTFIDRQGIALSLTFDEDQQIVKGWNYKRDWRLPRYHTPELLRTHLFRQFNNGSFGDGGRLYGAWWIGIPGHIRKRITINGEPTVELDYSGCAIRMLHHERGNECPDDPYFLRAIAAVEVKTGKRPGHYRDAIKALTQARINGNNRDKDMMCDLPGGISFSPHFKRNEVTAMIEAKHEAIADAFGSGAGIRLQRKDSDLALGIVTALMEKGIVALPIHDSFIVDAIHRDALFHEMKDQYRAMFGYDPIIK